jgi:WD40 repeat protein
MIKKGYANGQMKIWDVTKNDSSEYLEWVNKSEYSSICSISWNKNDKLLSWVTSMGEMYLMDPDSKEVLCIDKMTSSAGLSFVTFSQLYENIFFVGHNSGEFSLNVFNQSAKLSKTTFDLHSNKISELISSKLNENLLISLSLDQHVCLFDLNEGKAIQKINIGYPLLSGDLNEADYTLVVGGVEGMMEKFDLRKFDEPVITYKGHGDYDVKGLNYNKR